MNDIVSWHGRGPLRASLEGMEGATTKAATIFAAVCTFAELGALCSTGGRELWRSWWPQGNGQCAVAFLFAVTTLICSMSRWRMEECDVQELTKQLQDDEKNAKKEETDFVSRSFRVLGRLYQGSWSTVHLTNFGIVRTPTLA